MVAVQARVELDPDQHVVLRGMSWQDFEALRLLRGDRAGARMYYLDGEIEVMSSTKIHEGRKKTLARLLEILEKDAWVEAAKTKLFPKLDLVTFLDITPQSKAAPALRDALRTKKRRS